LQPPQVEGEAVPLPGQDLQPVPAAVAEDEQVAAQRIPGQMIPDHGLQPVEALASILRLDADPDPAGQSQSQHGYLPSAATRRATAAGSTPTETRTTRLVGRMTSTVGSEMTRTAAKVGAGPEGVSGVVGGTRTASSRRRASKG